MVTSKHFPFAGKTVAIIGGGVIGASWAALFAANRLKVVISDPDPDIAAKATAIVAAAQPALEGLGYEPFDIAAAVSFESDNAKAVANAFAIQECGPERPDFKQALWQAIERAAPADALLLSSSSGIPASVQQSGMTDQTRLVIGHPFNPPHLLPLVEVVPSPTSDSETVGRAVAFYDAMGKTTRVIRKEIQGFVANRLQAAIFRECVALVAGEVVTITELDDIVTTSLGVRWATSGPFLSFHLGGGAGGLPHFVEHLGGPMEHLWGALGKPTFDGPTKALIIDQANASYGATTIDALAEQRDAKEIAVINALAQVAP